MKLCMWLFAAGSVLAQNGTWVDVDAGHDIIGQVKKEVVVAAADGAPITLVNVAFTEYRWKISRRFVGGEVVEKKFDFSSQVCTYSYVPDTLVGGLRMAVSKSCTNLGENYASSLAPVAMVMAQFYSGDSRVPRTKQYDDKFAVVPLTTLESPQAVFLDGLQNALIKYDLSANRVIGQVTVPGQARAFGIRPESDEVWMAHGGTVNQISVSNLATQSIVGTIPTGSLDPNRTTPVGIVFTNSGRTALCAVSFSQADASGNLGALLVYDVPARQLKTTVPLSFAPSATRMAPDGLTAYVAGAGKLAYYDVFSGTADLVASISYFGGALFVSPDGTRLLYDEGNRLGVVDLNTRSYTFFTYNLAAGASALSVQMAQDGSEVTVVDTLGNVTTLDARFGTILQREKADSTATFFPGPTLN